MSAVFDQPTLWQRVRPMFSGFDGTLAVVAGLLATAGLITMYSAGFDHGTRFVDHARNMALALTLMFVVAQIQPQKLMGLAVPLYTVGIGLLVAVAVMGVTKKGATRWLNVGIVIQPSEILKIAMPLMLAWWFQRREGQLRVPDFLIALVLLAVPVGLIVKQPDLGTAILVLSAGLYVIFFAGLSWKLIVPVLVVGAHALRSSPTMATAISGHRAFSANMTSPSNEKLMRTIVLSARRPPPGACSRRWRQRPHYPRSFAALASIPRTSNSCSALDAELT